MIRHAQAADASRIAEISIFAKRMNYRSIFNDDKVSFGESKSASQSAPSGNFQQPSYQAAPAAKPAPDESVQIGDLGEFEEILSDGDVPF